MKTTVRHPRSIHFSPSGVTDRHHPDDVPEKIHGDRRPSSPQLKEAVGRAFSMALSSPVPAPKENLSNISI